MAILFNSLFFDVIAFLLTLLVYVYWRVSSKYNYWSSRGVPGPKPQLFFGSVKDLLLRRIFSGTFYQKIYNDFYGNKYVGMYFLMKPMLLINDLDLIKAVMVKDFAHFQDRDIVVHSKNRRNINLNLLILGGQSWKNLRSRLTPTFTSGKMKLMCGTMVECTRKLTNNMKALVDSEGCADFKEICARFTTDVVGSTVFGLETDAITNPDSVFRSMGTGITQPTFVMFALRFLLSFFPKFVQGLFNFSKNRERENFFLRLVQENVKLREEKNIVKNDFLQLLIEQRNIEKAEMEKPNHIKGKQSKLNDFEFDEYFMAGQCLVFFVAGFETSSTTMSFCLYELATNPAIQDKLREEIDVVLEQHDGQMTYDAVQDMKYLERVVDETLRKYPPATSLSRRCTIPYVLPESQVVVEEGMVVRVPIYALHHDAKYYPDPEKFDPDRFTQENKSKRPHFTYLPFGEGPRNCIGMRFGLLQAKIGLAALVNKYIFSPCGKTQVPLEFDPFSVTMGVKNGMWLRITERGDKETN